MSFGTCNVSFKGFDEFVLSKKELCNTEWKVSYNTGEVTGALTGGPVTELSRYNAGTNVKAIPKANVTIVQNTPTVTPTYEYEYDVKDKNSDGQKDITLISLDMKHDETTGQEKWAWIAYVDGKEVGHTVVDAGTPSTAISIKGNNGNTYTPDVHPSVLKHPEDESIPVHYYKINEKPDLIITSSI